VLYSGLVGSQPAEQKHRRNGLKTFAKCQDKTCSNPESSSHLQKDGGLKNLKTEKLVAQMTKGKTASAHGGTDQENPGAQPPTLCISHGEVRAKVVS
jgi:hypothetical protein